MKIDIKHYTKWAIKKVIDTLYPPKCLACNSEVVDDVGLFCNGCWSVLEFTSEPSCKCCGVPMPADYLGDQCMYCKEHKQPFEGSRFILRYTEAVKPMIHGFKFEDKIFYAKYLAQIMYSKFPKFVHDADLIVPVPMHKAKLRKRMYNHASLLAAHIAKESGIEFAHNALSKVVETKHQVGLNKEERQKNLRDSFAVLDSKIIEKKTVLLVDDVVTTGSTASECATTLKNAGAKKVLLITIARVY